MTNTKYLIDTNVFVRFQEGQQYDQSCFPVHYKNFLGLLDDEIAVSIDKVKDELNDDVFCEKYGNIFRESISNEISETYNDLRLKFPDYFDRYTLENPEDADPYLVTFAFHHNLCIVTQDEFQSSAGRILKELNVPTLCERLGGVCVDNKEKMENRNSYSSGFGCICLTELIRIEQLMNEKK